MTIIRPKKENGSRLLHGMIFSLSILLVGGVVGVIALYNQRINLEHDFEAFSLDLKSLEAENAELKDDLFKLFDSALFEQLAAERGLVLDTHPEYFTTRKGTHPWELASHF